MFVETTTYYCLMVGSYLGPRVTNLYMHFGCRLTTQEYVWNSMDEFRYGDDSSFDDNDGESSMNAEIADPALFTRGLVTSSVRTTVDICDNHLELSHFILHLLENQHDKAKYFVVWATKNVYGLFDGKRHPVFCRFGDFRS